MIQFNEEPTKAKKAKVVRDEDEELQTGTTEKYTVQQLKSLVDCLKVERSDDRDDWIRIGIILRKYNDSKECWCLIHKLQTKETYKVLAIKSAYGTGKTKALNYIITKYKPKKVLFVTYRQSLANNLAGSFEEHKFVNYLKTKNFKVDRLICQLESLQKTIDYCYFSDKLIIPKCDLVILDEIEGILNHEKSPTVQNQLGCFRTLERICKNATKIIALDGDFHNRAYIFLEHINTKPLKVVVNNYLPGGKEWKFSNDEELFKEAITNDLKAGKNLFIVSMSSEKELQYEEYINSLKYDVNIHIGKGDDGKKQALQDVNKYWKQFNVVIISPTIEAGVDFNVEHFHKMYVILSSKSTSQRGLMQMTNRVRKFKDNNVLVFLNHIRYIENGTFFNFDDAELMFNEKKLFNAFNYDENGQLSNSDRIFKTICAYNEMESLNKQASLFIPLLLQI